MKQLQPKNKRIVERHYVGDVDNTGVPPDDCPNWALSEDALKKYKLSAKDFDADYSTGDEDPRKKKKVKGKGECGKKRTTDKGKKNERKRCR